MVVTSVALTYESFFGFFQFSKIAVNVHTKPLSDQISL